MQATLIYNPNSGGADQVNPQEVLNALKNEGFYPVYEATETLDDLDRVLAAAKGLLVVAGGDGSVREVATRVIGKNVSIAILPVGTANNISRALGVSGRPMEIVPRLKDPLIRFFDVGHVLAPWGEDYFLEVFGYGLYADSLYSYRPEQGKSILRSIASVTETLAKEHDYRCTVRVDGEEISDDYIMFEVLNTTSFGPRLQFAPEAKTNDGVFEVVRILRQAGDSLLSYIGRVMQGGLEELDSVRCVRGSKIEIEWPGTFHLHVDAEVRPTPEEPLPIEGSQPGIPPVVKGGYEGLIRVEALHKALEFWLPAPGPGEERSDPGILGQLPIPSSNIIH